MRRFSVCARHTTAFLLCVVLMFVLVGCAEIQEEKETETVLVTVETEPHETEAEETDMTAVIDENLDLLASAYATVASAHPDGMDEHDLIAVHPDAFDEITTFGADAVPYLCEIGAGYQDAFANMRIAPEEYAKCILAYAAAQKIDPLQFDRSYPSPDGTYSLDLHTDVLWQIADSNAGILYDAVLCDADGNALVRTAGTSSFANVDWTEDGRYVVVSDRLMNEKQTAQSVVFDTAKARVIGLPGQELFRVAAASSGLSDYTIDMRYLAAADADVVRMWFCLKSAEQEIVGQYDYDLASERLTTVEYEPFDQAEDDNVLANFLEISDSSVGYLKIGTSVCRIALELKSEQGLARTLYINEKTAIRDFLFIRDIRVVVGDCIAIVTGGTDINSSHLYIFDAKGNPLFDTYYLTDKGMVFRGIHAVEEDKILLDGSRGYHGPTLVAPPKEQIMAGDYADWLYNDPISDTVSGGVLEQDEFGEVPLYRDRLADDLNFDLVLGGVYALPYLGNGKFGKIEHVETLYTLGEYLVHIYSSES